MDTHIKFEVNNIVYQSYKNGYKSYRNKYCINIDKQYNNAIFTVSEYTTASIRFINIPSGYVIYIDSYIGDYKLCKVCEEIVITDKNDERKLLPGDYEIILYKEEGKTLFKKYYFTITPSTVSFEELTKMKEYLSGYVQGITLNYDVSRNNRASRRVNRIFENVYREIEEWNNIKYEVEYLIKNPMSKLKKDYMLSRNNKRLDARSERKNNSRGFLYDNYSNKSYKQKMKLDYKTSENIALTHSLETKLGHLKDILNRYKKLLSNEHDKLNTIKNEYNNKYYENKSLKEYHSYMSKSIKRGIESRMKYLKMEQSKSENKINQMQDIIYNLNIVCNDVSNFYNRALDISGENNTIFHVTNGRYNEIISRLNDISNVDTCTKNNEKYFEFKKTETLFEYVCFFRVVQSLIDLGFECIDGWVKDALEKGFDFEIPSECQSFFEKNNKKIILIYDNEAPMELHKGYKGLISLNSKHRRPDITVLLYENDEFLRSLILEVKYRRSKYIYNENVDTEVVEIMKDYMQLWYHENDNKPGAVDKVILLYPYQDNLFSIKENFINKFSFIPISVSKFCVEQNMFYEIERFINNEEDN